MKSDCPPYSPRSDAGFSLIELIAVMVIFGILASIAAPSMNAYMERQKIRRALDTISTDVAHARILAIRQGTPVDIQFHGPTRYSVGPQGSDEEDRKHVRLDQQFGGIAMPFPRTSILFDSRGLVRTGSGEISVSMNGKTSELDLSITGRVYRGY